MVVKPDMDASEHINQPGPARKLTSSSISGASYFREEDQVENCCANFFSCIGAARR